MNIVYLKIIFNQKSIIMYKKVLPKIVLSLFLGSILLVASCSSDDDPNPPSISLSQTSIDVEAEETNSVDVIYSSEVGSATITVTKYLDGTQSGTPEVIPGTGSAGTYNYEFIVSVDDADSGIVKFNFTISDENGQTTQTELVVNIELTKRQLLLKYDWLLTDEIRQKTGESDINPVYTDDVYRFNEDGTYQKSIGDMVDAFGDIWYKHCEWDFDEESGVLKLHRTGAFADEAYDVMTITMIDENGWEANIVYYGLDIFDPGYDPEEDYVKKMSSQAKGSSFDPYLPGPDDDIEGPSLTPCNESDFVNN